MAPQILPQTRGRAEAENVVFQFTGTTTLPAVCNLGKRSQELEWWHVAADAVVQVHRLNFTSYYSNLGDVLGLFMPRLSCLEEFPCIWGGINV